MSMNLNFNENLVPLFDKLEEFLQAKTVMGAAINIAGVTIIPCISIGLGFGSGEKSVGEKKGLAGGGIGTGFKIEPVAFLIVQDGKTQILPVKQNSNMNKFLDLAAGFLEKLSPEMLPDIISKIKKYQDRQSGEESETCSTCGDKSSKE